MKPEHMWAVFSEKNGIKENEYDVWAFGAEPDLLAEMVLRGIKRATSSAYPVYGAENEPLPKEGYSVITDSRGEAVCIIRTTKVYVTPFNRISAEHAAKEGEGDGSLEYWKDVHRQFFTAECLEAGVTPFDENMPVVCEEFEVVYR